MTIIVSITGLDLAGPLFERTTKDVRIDKSDCSYVDIIHTNGGNEDDGFLGINAAVGHADYYPNGGHKQPKCNNNFVCSHGEAPWIWVDSGLAYKLYHIIYNILYFIKCYITYIIWSYKNSPNHNILLYDTFSNTTFKWQQDLHKTKMHICATITILMLQ